MNARPLRYALQAAAVAAVLALLSLLVWRLVQDPGGGVGAALARGDHPKAPNFDLPRLDGRGNLSFASLDGKPRVLDFFASWCAACPYESKRIERAVQKYGGLIAFVGVDTKDFSGDAKRYVRRYHLSYPIVRDGDGSVLSEWGGIPIPRIFFIDRRGIVIGEMQAEEDLPRFLEKLAESA
jgi:cytochrome c biogenesis protein CcmG, thiol:disulfide interchange protein DsbE